MIHFPNRWAPAAAAACAVVTLAAPSAAQDRATKLEAKKHYVRGVELYDAEDYLGAAEAFKKAHALLQRPVILFNLGLSYDKLGRPVEAVETLEKVVSAPGKLAKRHVATAKKTLAANAAKVATLLVTSNVAGSTIVVNGREIGKAPLAKPVRVKAGKVLTRSFAAQHMPAYQTVQAAPGQTTKVAFDLTQAEKPLAQVRVKATLPDAELWIDGFLVARTPIRSTFAVEAGKPHRVELRREGYETAVDNLTLQQGATGEVTLAPKEDRKAIASAGAKLALDLNQKDATIFIDGERKEFGDKAIGLAAGAHEIRAERTGYVPLTRRVTLTPGQLTTAAMMLPPTPETRAQLVGDAESRFATGLGLAIGGGVLAGVSAGIIGWNRGERSDAEALKDDLDGKNGTPPAPCDRQNNGTDEERAACNAARTDASSAVTQAIALDIAFGAGIAIGAVGLATGIGLIASGDDPDMFRLKLDDDDADAFAFEATPELTIDQNRVIIGARGRF